MGLSKGIRIEGCTSVAIGNLIKNCTFGIYVSKSSAAGFSNNTAAGNRYGIYLEYSSGAAVGGNDFSSSTVYGIYILNSNGSWIIGNDCSKSGYAGISLSLSSNGNEISRNDCSGGAANGIESYDSYANNFSWNDCTGNARIGILLINSPMNYFEGGNCSYSGEGGMRIQSSSGNVIVGTNLSYVQSGYGAYLHVSSNNNTFENCTFSFNMIGVQIDNCTGTTLSGCRIHNNSVRGLLNSGTDPAYAVQATNCWWGSPSGPSVNGPGSGDPVSKNVIYYPWEGDKAKLTLILRASATSFNMTSPGDKAIVKVNCTLSPYITAIPVNFRVTDPSGQVKVVTANATASKFSVDITLDKAGNWTVVAEVPGNEFLEASASGVLSIAVSAPSGAAAAGMETAYAGIAIVVAVALVGYALIKKKKTGR